MIRILAPAFFARQDTRTPMRFALASVAANIVCGVALFKLIGFKGIAAATAIASWLNVLLMLATLMRRGFYRPSPQVLSRLLKLLLCSAALCAALAAASDFRPRYQHGIFHRKEIAVVAVSALGLLLYAALLLGFKAVTLQELKSALRRRPRPRSDAAPSPALPAAGGGPKTGHER
jgi:putative peptidoglycan lipid II flippase